MRKACIFMAVAMIVLALVPSMGSAQGLAMPCRFHGTVTADGAAVADGTVITATIDGDEYTTTTPAVYGASSYALTISPAEGVTYAEGSTITFMIGDHSAAETGVWESGGNSEQDLSASIEEPPTVYTSGATHVPTGLPTLNATLDGLGTASSVEVSFEWGLATSYGNQTTPETMTSIGSFSAELSGLTPYTTYQFRAKAVGNTTAYGENMSFMLFILGDANMDGIVDGRDVIRTKKIILGIT